MSLAKIQRKRNSFSSDKDAEENKSGLSVPVAFYDSLRNCALINNHGRRSKTKYNVVNLQNDTNP